MRVLFGLYVVQCIELSILLSHRSNATLRRIVNMAALYDITYTLRRDPDPTIQALPGWLMVTLHRQAAAIAPM